MLNSSERWNYFSWPKNKKTVIKEELEPSALALLAQCYVTVDRNEL